VVQSRSQVVFTPALVLGVLLGIACPPVGLGDALGSQNAEDFYPGVCIDPGHGGPNACQYIPPTGPPGCQAYGSHGPNDLTEDWVNQDVAERLYSQLSYIYTYARLTRTSLTDSLSIEDRARIANEDENVDLLISVHHNADSTGTAQGTETFWYDYQYYPGVSGWSQNLAEQALVSIWEKFGYDMRGAFPSNFLLLRRARMPATLTEASFITEADEAELLEEDSHRQEEANGLRNAFLEYCDGVSCPEGLACEDDETFDLYRFSWLPVEGADGYVLYYYPVPGYTCYGVYPAPICEVAETQCTVSYDDMICGAYDTWHFAVQAYVENGQSGPFFGGLSEWLDSSRCTPVSITRDIWNIVATGGEHQVTLSWKASDFEEGEGFYIYRSPNGGQCYDCDPPLGYVPFDPEQQDYSLVDTSTAYSTTYFYKIEDTEGHDWWGPAFAAPTSGVENPPMPSPTPTLAVDRIGHGYVHLCLEEGSEYASYYRVSWKPEGGSWTDTLHHAEKCLDRPDLDNRTVYIFKAIGENISGQTGSSIEVSAMPMPPPINFRGEPGYECIHLWWEGVDLASGYRLYYSSDSQNVWAEVIDLGDTTATTLTGLENGVLYYTRVVAYDQFGNDTDPSNPYNATPHGYLTVQTMESHLPESFALGTNFPNPFNPSTVIPYKLPEACGHVRIDIYDARGRRVRTLVNAAGTPGCYSVSWDGRDDRGRIAPTGVYFCHFEAGHFSQTKKMLLLK